MTSSEVEKTDHLQRGLWLVKPQMKQWSGRTEELQFWLICILFVTYDSQQGIRCVR